MMSYKYDLAISFAGEQRDLARSFATRLDASGYSIFFDEFREAELWGRDLSIELNDIYSNQARYCLIIVSQNYIQKPWTNQERRAAISRMINRGDGYLLCLKIEDIELPGLSSVINYISLARHPQAEIYKLLLQKLGSPNHQNQISTLSADDKEIAREIIGCCFRRAIYTRMDSEISMDAMYESIGRALGQLQQIAIRIGSPAMQLACNQIIMALDKIERIGKNHRGGISCNLPIGDRTAIDSLKQEVVRLLLDIRRAADLPMQLPFAIRTDHFWSAEQADETP